MEKTIFFIAVFLMLTAITESRKRKLKIVGICNFPENGTGPYGEVTFALKRGGTLVNATIKGLTSHKHGFTVHTAGNIEDNCTRVGQHYNPKNYPHGRPVQKHKHVGDFGNLDPNGDGTAHYEQVLYGVRMLGEYSIIGRPLVIHEKEDDFGMDKSSKMGIITGSSGKAIACCIIGRYNPLRDMTTTVEPLTSQSPKRVLINGDIDK